MGLPDLIVQGIQTMDLSLMGLGISLVPSVAQIGVLIYFLGKSREKQEAQGKLLQTVSDRLTTFETTMEQSKEDRATLNIRVAQIEKDQSRVQHLSDEIIRLTSRQDAHYVQQQQSNANLNDKIVVLTTDFRNYTQGIHHNG